MARGRRGGSSKEDIRHNDKHSSNDYDRSSMLPDEVLVCILSFLTLKEAIATSILSRRWRYVWTCLPRLDFDGFESLLNVDLAEGNRILLLDQERRNYIEWVSHVLTLHKLSSLEEFRVFYNLNRNHKSSIDEWLRYALSRKVQKLELNLTDDASRRIRRDHEYYTFPYELLRAGDESSMHFMCLKKISLRYVNVTGEAVQFFLSNCPLLEDISVCRSLELTSLNINGPLPLLKRLEITLCHNLKSVEIRDAGLVYLKYIGSKIHFFMENVTLLVDLFIGGMLTDNMEDALSLFSSYLPQLEIFTMQRLGEPSWKETELFYSVVRMSNLKIFELRVDVLYNHSLLPLTKLLSASPCLQRFVLEVLRSNPDFDKKKIQKVVSSYPHLKEFMFVGYYGVTSDLELVMHFLENAVALETVVVDPSEPCESTYHYVYRYKSELKGEIIEKEINARARAKKQLTKIVPPSINLYIL